MDDTKPIISSTTTKSVIDCPIFYRYLGDILKIEYTYSNYNYIRELLNMLDLDDILKYLSPKRDPSYKSIQLHIINCIGNITPELYIKLADSGFTAASLFHVALKLIENLNDLDEFRKYESVIFQPQFENTWLGCYELFKHKLLENPVITYPFITDYLIPKYPVLFKSISKIKIAIAKGCMPAIYENLKNISDTDIHKINTKFCTVYNIVAHKWFDWDITLDDFLEANKEHDLNEINLGYYLKYFARNNLKIKQLQTGLDKYPVQVIRQLLPHIIIEPETLAHCNLPVSELLQYIQIRLSAREYNTNDFLLFIANISEKEIINMNNPDEIDSVTPPGLEWPWLQLATFPRSFGRNNPVSWIKIREFINPAHHFNIYSYFKFLSEQNNQPGNWPDDILIEFWNIFKHDGINNWMSNSDKYRLLDMCPIQYILKEPVEEIVKYKLYRHGKFGNLLITNPTLKTDLATLVINYRNYNEIARKELEFLLRNVFSPDDILTYFKTPDYVQIIYEYGFYDKLPLNVLRELVPLCHNLTSQHTFYHAISVKSRQETEIEQKESFIRVFNEVILFNCAYKPYDILMNVIAKFPTKSWMEDNYKYAIKYQPKYFNLDILQQIRNEFKYPNISYPPEFNWSIITKLLGNNSNILKYPDLPWITPLYFAQDNYWISKAFYYEFVINHTFLFSTDSVIWQDFSKSLPLDFIYKHPYYSFKWSDIIQRSDFKVNAENWPILKECLTEKEIYNITSRVPIDIIIDNLNLNWNWRFIFENVYPSLANLPKILRVFDNMNAKNCLPILCTMNKKNIAFFRNSIFIRAIIYDFQKFQSILSLIRNEFCYRPHIGNLVLEFLISGLIKNS